MRLKPIFLPCMALSICLGACSTKSAVFGWTSTDNQFTRSAVEPEKDNSGQLLLKDSAFEYPAWRGEKVSAQAVLLPDRELREICLTVTELKGKDGIIPAECVEASFVEYVMGDVLNKDFCQCDQRPRGKMDSLYIADRISSGRLDRAAAGICQPVWLSVSVPADTKPGTYEGQLRLRTGIFCGVSLPIRLEVCENLLPEPSEWEFHLDLWQNPYSVARYHGVELWSEEHFRAMEPVMRLLADAGQKVVTATVLDRPWNGQTEDAFGSMVRKTKFADGRWEYDFDVFDKWVEFMDRMGISSQINCYSMIPWKLTFDFINGETGETEYFQCATDSPEYHEYWGSFLKAFAEHLRTKGWFDKTMIAMDERPADAMKNALRVIREAVPDMKVSLAGNWHESLADELADYCVAMREPFPAAKIAGRRAEGKVSTWYTCCAERCPNTFLISRPAEAEWIGWHTLARGCDGYLRWAYNSWTADPIKDGRFRTWPAGDCFMVYPNGQSSPHFERLREGIQDFEKVRILKGLWEAEGNETAIRKLEAAIGLFTPERILSEGAEPALTAAKAALAEQD